MEGGNTLAVTAYDKSGNSTTLTRSFTYEKRQMLALSRMVPEGQAATPDKAGVLALKASPAKNATPLTKGSALQFSNVLPDTQVTVTASAKKGHLFSHWEGLPEGAQVAGNVVTFTMPAEDVPGLTAHFIVNPFLPIPGSEDTPIFGGHGASVVLQGLLLPYEETTPSNATVGLLTATLAASNGNFSGKVLIDGKSTSCTGMLQGDGSVWFKVGKGLSASLPLNGTTEGKTLVASWYAHGLHAEVGVHGVALSEVLARPAIYNKTHPVPGALLNQTRNTKGYFTLTFPSKAQLPPYDAPATYPQGTGYATLTLTNAGTLKLTGVLADGTKITASGVLVTGDESPIFIPLTTPGAKASVKDGSFLGTLVFDTNAEESDVGGTDWLWFRPQAVTAAAKAQAYRAGWPEGITLDPVGTLYDATVSVQETLGLATTDAATGNARLDFEAGKLDPAVAVVNLNVTGNKVTKIPANDKSFTLSAAAKTGLLKGTFPPNWTSPAKKLPAFQCVLLQKGGNKGGFGFFLSNSANDLNPESGEVMLSGP